LLLRDGFWNTRKVALYGKRREGEVMSASGRYVARYDAEENMALIFDADGNPRDDGDAACMSDMLSELLDEMIRRGFDPETASFTIGRK